MITRPDLVVLALSELFSLFKDSKNIVLADAWGPKIK
jgi:hypothetical protein